MALLFWGALLSAGSADTKEALYLRATKLYKQKQYAKATPLFRSTLSLFVRAQKKQTPGSRSWHQMTLARCDILVRLASMSWASGQKRRSCRRYKEIDDLHQTLPVQWVRWMSHSPLPGLIKGSLRRYRTDCRAIGTRISFVLSPAQATLALRDGKGRWMPIKGSVLETSQNRLDVQVSARGYVTLVVQLKSLPRWGQMTRKVSLERARRKLARVRPLGRRVVVARKNLRTLQRTPIYKTWWFWTITGIVVAGGATAAIVVSTNQPSFVFRGSSENTPHRIW